jgi:drug/metabolite transporter (DMT)-like permease
MLEHSVMPGIGSAGAAVLVGIVPAAFANLAWDEAFRRGDSQLLAVAAYGTPLCSALLLSLLGLAPEITACVLQDGRRVFTATVRRSNLR